jgi:hypothetical protein
LSGSEITQGAETAAQPFALLRISVGEAKRIVVKMALERMKRSWPAHVRLCDDQRLWHAGESDPNEPSGLK